MQAKLRLSAYCMIIWIDAEALNQMTISTSTRVSDSPTIHTYHI